MKFFFGLVISFCIAQVAFASPSTCRSQLTNDLKNNSSVFSVNVDEVNITAPVSDKMGQAIQIVRSLVQKQGCTRADLSFGRGSEGVAKSKCSYINPEKTASLGCYLETNLGYFFVHWDMGHTANIIFNLWD